MGRSGEPRESLVYCEVAQITDAADRAHIREEVARRLQDVLRATGDFHAMLETADRVVTGLAERAGALPERRAEFTEVQDFLRWLRDGAFVFLDRIGDAMRLGGFLVAPEEIAAYLETHPAVRGCQVVGVNAEGGPGAVAFVIAAPGAAFSEDDLRAHCRAGMAGFKVPRRFLAVEDFPTTDGPNGVKIQRAKLREMAAALEA